LTDTYFGQGWGIGVPHQANLNNNKTITLPIYPSTQVTGLGWDDLSLAGLNW